jgi:hypothetical protein
MRAFAWGHSHRAVPSRRDRALDAGQEHSREQLSGMAGFAMVQAVGLFNALRPSVLEFKPEFPELPFEFMPCSQADWDTVTTGQRDRREVADEK